MKKTIAIIFAAFILSTTANAQAKKDSAQQQPKDTTIAVVMPLDQFKALLFRLDQLIDSKSASREILGFLQQSAQIMQPADKPKEETKPKPKN